MDITIPFTEMQRTWAMNSEKQNSTQQLPINTNEGKEGEGVWDEEQAEDDMARESHDQTEK